MKYKLNLKIEGNNVAPIKDEELIQHGWWYVTTQKHINYVANFLDLKQKI